MKCWWYLPARCEHQLSTQHTKYITFIWVLAGGILPDLWNARKHHDSKAFLSGIWGEIERSQRPSLFRVPPQSCSYLRPPRPFPVFPRYLLLVSSVMGFWLGGGERYYFGPISCVLKIWVTGLTHLCRERIWENRANSGEKHFSLFTVNVCLQTANTFTSSEEKMQLLPH